MDDNRIKELEEKEKKLKARNKYINDFQKSKYDRIILLVPKGQKAVIDQVAKNNCYNSTADYLREIITADINKQLKKENPEKPKEKNQAANDPYFPDGLPFD